MHSGSSGSSSGRQGQRGYNKGDERPEAVSKGQVMKALPVNHVKKSKFNLEHCETRDEFLPEADTIRFAL